MRSSVSSPTTSTTQIRSDARPFGQSLRHHLALNHGQHADACRPRAQHHDLLLRQRAAGDLRSAVQRAEGDGRGALDVVVEREQLVAVALEDRQCVRGGEVLPLQQHVGQFVVDGGDELVDELEVVVVADPPVPPAQVLRIFEQFHVVGAHVKHDRQRARRVDAADEGVQRELPDRDAHPADALIPEAENPLPVGHDDHVDVSMRVVAQHLAEQLAVGISSRTAREAGDRSR